MSRIYYIEETILVQRKFYSLRRYQNCNFLRAEFLATQPLFFISSQKLLYSEYMPILVNIFTNYPNQQLKTTALSFIV